MDFSLLHQLRDSQFRTITIIFYLVCFLLALVAFAYVIFVLQISFANQQIVQLDKKIATYNAPQYKADEKKVLAYKKKIDDFTTIIDHHNISSNVFSFMEQNTLPNVWFFSTSVLETKQEIDLVGEAQDMDTFSRQIKIFEESQDYVSSIKVLNSQVAEQGKVKFALNLSLNPNIFHYYPAGFISSVNLPQSTSNSPETLNPKP